MFAVFAVFAVFALLSCDKKEELTDWEQPGLLLSAESGFSLSIPARFYIFENSDYDPKSFKRADLLAPEGTLTNSKGEIVNSIKSPLTTKQDPVKVQQLKPGKYYIICAPTGFQIVGFMNLWKGKGIVVEKIGKQNFKAKFESLYDKGFIEWDK